MSKVFQLTAVSQNDPGCAYGAEYTGEVTNVTGGVLRKGKGCLQKNETVPLPIPPPPNGPPPPASPTWFLILDEEGIEKASFTIVIKGPDLHKPFPIPISLEDVKKWKEVNKNTPTNQIYKKGDCGIFGYAAPIAPDGWIYTITVAVNHPQV